MSVKMRRTGRMGFAAAAAALVLALSGCGVGNTESKLPVYEEVTNELAEQIVEMIPVEFAPVTSVPRAEVRDGGPGTEAPTDAVWWQFEQSIQLADASGASIAASEAIAQGLEADGWDQRHVRETEGGLRVADGYRKTIDDGGWYIEVTHVRYPEPTGQRIEVIIVSPATVRGEAASSGR